MKSVFWFVVFVLSTVFFVWFGSAGLYLIFHVWFIQRNPATYNLLMSAVGFLLFIVPFSVVVFSLRLHTKAQKEEEKKENEGLSSL